ncbi:efflux transporter outer membrane subunit [Phenylobacterium sp.]|uniref:efflux transporter outer membrane subunit n=1 Tax=Phenylobacterium sp. TaxID=1871053 RepID=UPI0035B34FC8
MRPLRALALAAIIPALAACASAGDDYAVPKSAAVNAPAARAPFLASRDRGVAQEPLPDRWWRLYDDETLNGLVEEALAANADLRVAAANLERAQARAEEADRAGGVDVTLSAAAERARMSGEAFLLDSPIPVENLADAGVGVSYEVDVVGRIRRAAEAAHADAEASQAGADLARVTVAAGVARAYVDACSANEALAVAQRSVDLAERRQSAAERLAAGGRGTPAEVAKARAATALAHAAAPQLEARKAAALYELAMLTGKPPADFPKAVESCARPPSLREPIPIGDGAALLRRRPDVRQAERALAGAVARVGVAKASLYPTVRLGLSAGSTGLLADLGQPAANRWSVGPLISWTLPGAGEHARVRQAEAGSDAALARFDSTVLNALRESETSLSDYARELDQRDDLRRAVQQAQIADDLAQRLHAAGKSPYLDSLDSQRVVTDAQARLAAADGKVAADQVAVFLALGGGW